MTRGAIIRKQQSSEPAMLLQLLSLQAIELVIQPLSLIHIYVQLIYNFSIKSKRKLVAPVATVHAYNIYTKEMR